MDKRRDLLRFRIELVGILPPIWREILVPASYSFWDLHVAIQDAMGWLDSHLHEFRLGGRGRNGGIVIGLPDQFGIEGEPEVLAEGDVPVIDHLSQPGGRVEYEYDFGDGWVHELTLIGIEPREKGRRYPQCVAGARAAPPEDCGGVPGYQNLVDALLDPAHGEFDAMGEWIPPGWGPELFKVSDVRFDNPSRRWKQMFLNEHPSPNSS